MRMKFMKSQPLLSNKNGQLLRDGTLARDSFYRLTSKGLQYQNEAFIFGVNGYVGGLCSNVFFWFYERGFI